MKILAPLLVPLLLLTACAQPDPAAPDAGSAGTAAPAGTDPAVTTTAAADGTAPVASTDTPGFDLDAVPLSTAALGAFPYIALPSGYASNNLIERPFERYPYWTGHGWEWVEGRLWSAGIKHQDDNLFSALELQTNLDAVLAQAGAQRVFRGSVPPAQIQALNNDNDRLGADYYFGFRALYSPQYTSWVIRRDDRQIWIQAGSDNREGGLVISETRAVAITASLLPADALRQALADTGKVDIQVNFASDSAQILAESQPQIAQVTALLADDAGLALSINGHTDSSGNAARNLQLSRLRADSVVAALVAAGIAPERLQSAGFGDTQPRADNATEQGRASNRRVELVKR